MKTLILFDSNFGNTKNISYQIAKSFDNDTTVVVSADDFRLKDCQNIDLLIVGCPIIGWQPTEKIIDIFNQIKDEMNDFYFTTFDTRIKMFFHGDAMNKMAKMITQIGGEQITESQYFFVGGKKGPILVGETAKADAWAKEILFKMSVSK